MSLLPSMASTQCGMKYRCLDEKLALTDPGSEMTASGKPWEVAEQDKFLASCQVVCRNLWSLFLLKENI